MARMKPDELILLHNNIAKNKRLPYIPANAKMSLTEVADAIEVVNRAPFPGAKVGKIRRKFYNSKYPPIWEIAYKKFFKKSGNGC